MPGFDCAAPLRPHGFPQEGIVCQVFNRGQEPRDIAHAEDKATDLMPHEFRHVTDGGSHDRQAARHGLHNNIGGAFAFRGEHEEVGFGVKRPDIIELSAELQGDVEKTERTGHFLQFWAEGAIAD